MPTTAPADVVIRHGRPEDAKRMTELMVQSFETRLRFLGLNAMTIFHRHLITSRFGLCFVAERDGQVIATAGAILNSKKFYREFLLHKGLACAGVALPHLFNPRNLRIIFTVQKYFTHIPNNDPEAEWLNLFVDSSAQGLGLGNELWNRILEGFRAHGVREFKIGTDVRNERANRMYQQRGGRLVRTEALYHDTQTNIYVCRMPKDGTC